MKQLRITTLENVQSPIADGVGESLCSRTCPYLLAISDTDRRCQLFGVRLVPSRGNACVRTSTCVRWCEPKREDDYVFHAESLRGAEGRIMELLRVRGSGRVAMRSEDLPEPITFSVRTTTTHAELRAATYARAVALEVDKYISIRMLESYDPRDIGVSMHVSNMVQVLQARGIMSDE